MKLHVIEVRGDEAHFRKHYTNMSPLSFFIPPRTAITGMLGAILGIDRSNLYETFSPSKCFIGIMAVSKFKSTVRTVNYLRDWTNTNGKSPTHNPTPIEYIQNPKYRIFVKHFNDDIDSQLLEKFKSCEMVYPLFLGNNNCLASYSYEGTISSDIIQPPSDEWVEVSSPIQKNNILEFDIPSITGNIKNDTMCRDLTSKDRTPIEYMQYIYTDNALSIKVKLKPNSMIYTTPHGNIMEF